VFSYVHDAGLLEEHEPETEYATHTDLVEVLRNGTPEEFRETMRLHLTNHFKRIL